MHLLFIFQNVHFTNSIPGISKTYHNMELRPSKFLFRMASTTTYQKFRQFP